MTLHSPPTEARILVIDDTVSIHDDFRKILTSTGAPPAPLLAAHAKVFGDPLPATLEPRLELDCVTQGQEGLACVQRALAAGRPYAVAFVDMRMPPGWDGIETVRHLWSVDPALQVVICTAYSDRTWEDTLAQLGPTDSLLILKKPFDNIEALQLARTLSTKWAITRRDRDRLADLDERVRQRTSELHDAEGRFTRIFQASPVPTALQTIADGRFIDANPAFLALAGLEHADVIARTGAELQLWPETDVWRLTVDSLAHQAPLRSQAARLRSRERGLRDVRVSVEQVHGIGAEWVVTSIEDVTERLLLEKRFQQSQKMEAVGQLASGIAHDFNNLLTVIQCSVGLLSERSDLDSSDQTALAQVRSAAERAAGLTRQLLIFSRRQISLPEPLDVAAMLARLRENVSRVMPPTIATEWHCAAALPRIFGDEANLQQAIMNLIVNARDAMPHGGRLVFTVEPQSLDQVSATRHPFARTGDYLRIAIADSGEGMSAEALSHLFEPFFTTKGFGQGTGLGLSTAFGIVRQHAGWIDVASKRGEGSTFAIYLPTHPETGRPDLRATDDADVRGRGERILLVEDEQSVRVATAMILSRAGYNVTEASDGPNALGIWNAAPRPFDLLFTDMVMPNSCTGAELAAQLRARQPALKVILTTGFSRELLRPENAAAAHARLLLKPFSNATLLSTVREVLDAPE